MPYEQVLPEWNAPGIEPPQSLKDGGWKAPMKPPDAYFNWFMHTTYQALLELQTKAASKGEVVTEASVQEKINAAVAALIEGAPGALDTLNELAAAMGDDPNFAATVTNALAQKETPAGAQLKAEHTTLAKKYLNEDANGVFTTVEYYRKSDKTLSARSVLSGGTSPKYTTRTITKYAADGVTVVGTEVDPLTYNSNGVLISEV